MPRLLRGLDTCRSSVKRRATKLLEVMHGLLFILEESTVGVVGEAMSWFNLLLWSAKTSSPLHPVVE